MTQLHRPGTAILDQGPLMGQWPTFDPFIMCNHHVDDYPAANSNLGPDAELDGRELGADFADLNGWNMYHGDTVPGFPRHPHRGFETVTYLRAGYVDHSDSLGATARYGDGDVQWLTAGRGIEHAEMFPLLDAAGPNRLELFQLWLNLPAATKLAPPQFKMLWREDIPRVRYAPAIARSPGTVVPRGSTDAGTGTGVITVIAGHVREFAGTDWAGGSGAPPDPPVASWAARPKADVAVWHIAVSARGDVRLPPAVTSGRGLTRTLYVMTSAPFAVDGRPFEEPTFLRVDPSRPITISAAGLPVEALMLQGRAIREPVAQYGPFVMNSDEELMAAFADYERGTFGTWPWGDDAPVHAPSRGRFAKHVDGHVEIRP